MIRKTAAALALAFGAALALSGCGVSNETAQVCHVDDKDRSTGPKGATVYRVYTSCGVFAVEDNILLGQFNSADTYAKIQPGKTYRLTTYGFRNGFFSMFPNIRTAEEVAK